MRKLLLVVLLSCSCASNHKGSGDAELFLRTFYPEAATVMAHCQKWDTDHNGYVSCTGKVGDKVISLECPLNDNLGLTDFQHNTECRLSKGAVVSAGSE